MTNDGEPFIDHLSAEVRGYGIPYHTKEEIAIFI